MLWSPAILLLLAGAAIANTQNGWKDGKEYNYKIRSRTLAAFNQQSKQFTGVIIEGQLKVQSNGPNTLRAKILQPRYSPFHARLENGWDSEIPREQLNLQSLPLNGQPFEIKMKNGVVQDLVVDKDVPTWEVNVIKSIVGQLQVDTRGENALSSSHNQFPENNQPFALFKTMEDSVSGKCEVLYDISPLPEQMRQNKPELAPMPELREDGDLISVVKTKNYTNCDQRVSYHFGIDRSNGWEPGSNDNSKFLSRSTVSRVVLSGKLNKYTIQSSVTTNKVVHSADLQEKEQGMVASKMNLTLHEVKDLSEQMPSPPNPQSTGNLVYNYNNPFESSTSRRPNKHNKRSRDKNQNKQSQRNKQSDERNSDESRSNSDESMFNNDDNSYLQPRPTMTQAPRNPMLPFFIGYRGNSVLKNNKVDAVKSAIEIAQQIGVEMQKPDTMPDEQTLEKFTILTRLVRLMNADQITETQRTLFEHRKSPNQLDRQTGQGQSARRNAWVAFRDAVAEAGTGPALINIKQMIQNKDIEGREAAHIVDTVAKAARTPTPEYVDTYFEMAMQQQTKDQPPVRDAAILAFADLVRYSAVDRLSAHNRYPVHAFGRLFSKRHPEVHEKYIPRMAEELNDAVEKGDSKKIQVYVNAIGRTGDPRMLAVFEPYMEGKKQVSPFQRLAMVLSLSKLTKTHPKLARSVLYKIYSNAADHHEIRTAAVYLLMETNPPASMLQRMAEYTNFDSNKNVNSAVKSTIESLARIEGEQYRDLSNAARSAQPLLTPEDFRLQHSRNTYMKLKNPLTQSGLSFQIAYIGSTDSIVPKGVYLSTSPTFKGIKLSNVDIGGAVSSVRDLWNLVQENLNKKQQKENSKVQKDQEQKFSPENIAKMLGIRGDDPQQLEGFGFGNGRLGDFFLAYDNHTIEKMPHRMKEIAEELKRGKEYEETKLKNYEVTISFPMETGFPFQFTLKTPSMMSIEGVAKLMETKEDENKSPLPKSGSISGKLRIVLAMDIQKRLGFVTPFEHQQYTVGIDRNVQMNLPLRGEIKVDTKKRELRMEAQPNEDVTECKVLQYKTQPFTSKHDILNLEPITKDKNTQIIHKNKVTKSSEDLNDENSKSKLQFNWEMQTWQSEEESQNHKTKKENNMQARNKLVKSMMTLYYPNEVDAEYQKYTIKLIPSNDMKAELKVSYDSMTDENDKNSEESENSPPNAKAPRLDSNLSEGERKQKLMREAMKNMNSAKSKSIDINVKLNGLVKSSMSITGALGMSKVEQKCRGLLYVSSKKADDKQYYLSAAFEGKKPDTQSLDFEKILEANDETKLDAEIRYGKGNGENNEDDLNKIKIQGKARQTEERKNEIRQSRDAQACSKDEKQKGNKLTLACQKTNERASCANEGEITITSEKESTLKNTVMNVMDSVEWVLQQVGETKMDRQDRTDKNKAKILFQLSPNDERIDITLKTPEGKLQGNNIKLNPRNKENNGNVKDSRNKEDPDLDMTKNNVCNLDKTEAKTFDNRRYSLKLGQCWHVAMTTFPKNNADNPSQQMLIPEKMHASILTKENEDGKKELKITLGENEIKLSRPSEVEAKVNGERVKLHKKKSFQGKQDNKVTFELFKLSDDSVKLSSDKYDIEIVYDGLRAQIEAGEKYRKSVRGLCGNNDGEPENDMKTPKGCLLQRPEEFSATYALTNDEKCEGPAKENLKKAKNAECTFQNRRTGNVISEQEAGRESERRGNNKNNDRDKDNDNDNDNDKHCMKHRTMVTRNENEICFSLRPIPKCSSRCSPDGKKTKNIDFHCVARSSASEKVADRVEKGANPDLSQKGVSKTEIHQVPISCKA